MSEKKEQKQQQKKKPERQDFYGRSDTAWVRRKIRKNGSIKGRKIA